MAAAGSSSVVDTVLAAARRVEELMDAGGPVMWPLLGVSLLSWGLILDRYWYFLRVLPRVRRRPRSEVEAVELRIALWRHLRLIRTLSGILPMLGLLGTVTGIVETFDLIRVFGSAETRIVARGVSQALITTLTGLVMGLSGVGAGYDLSRRAEAGERAMIGSRSP
ncbi:MULTISPECIES: MotA/TolQ/ExbB proton channel family protein [Methylococcus]|jgi:biopolymer transport protein ExbB|uniref:Biopolymer transport protein ExbB n=1 Tax=Methylococcus capsulatus TaxID=414 RepID=A0AA35UAU4_METCP|nr:MotA/TolQ/ExbB proton channel family protein [Methylococcus capsulatus]CAI8766193.1 biopolymer transport protein ExbB [Methylococcus capsulatus]